MKHFQNSFKSGEENGEDITWEVFYAIMLAGFGEMDPDLAGYRKLFKTRQRGRHVNEYIHEFRFHLAEISTSRAPNQATPVVLFREHLDDSLTQAVSINPQTLRPWEALDPVVQAAMHLGNAAASHAPSGSGGPSSSKPSSKKRSRDTSGNGGSPPAKKANSSGSKEVAMTPSRSDEEKAYLRKHNLCFHCISQDPSVHRVGKCPHKYGPDRKEAAKMPKGWDKGKKDFAWAQQI